MKYGEIYLSKTWTKLYPISTRVGKPNVADEPFNEQKKTTCFVHMNQRLGV